MFGSNKWLLALRRVTRCARRARLVVFVAAVIASPLCAGVGIYQDVFYVERLGSDYTSSGEWGTRYVCYSSGEWGTPILEFILTREVSGGSQTTTLTALEPEWPIVELDTYPPNPSGFPAGGYDDRAAWFATLSSSAKVSVSNTIYRSRSVLWNQGTGHNLTVEPYTFTSETYETTTLYLCYGHPNGTTVGWVRIRIYADDAWYDGSCVATGVYSLQVGTTTYTLWPATLLEGGVRQLDIYVDGSAAAGGTGCSWDSPFRTIQAAVDAVRLDGTTVHVKPGVYGPATFDKTKFYKNGLSCTITVESTDGPEKTIIDGGWRGETSFPTYACFNYGDDISTRLSDTVRGFTLCGAYCGVENGRIEYCIVSNCVRGVRGSSAYNCLITGNTGIGFGGYGLQNCTVVGNAIGATLPFAVNSVIWGNEQDGAYDSSFWYSTNCCIPVVSKTDVNNILMVGPGNIMKDPRFVNAAAGDYRLRPDSPCIDAGAAGGAVGATDLSGGMRVRGAGVDIGCFEFVPTVSDTNATDGVVVPPEWLEAHYGLDRAASPDAAYQAASLAETANLSDGTASGGRLSAWESYLWDLDPTDSSQYPHAEIEMVDGAPRVRIVPSSPNRTYTLLGKDSLNAQNWARSPDLSDAAFLSTNRFFKVSVELK